MIFHPTVYFIHLFLFISFKNIDPIFFFVPFLINFLLMISNCYFHIRYLTFRLLIGNQLFTNCVKHCVMMFSFLFPNSKIKIVFFFPLKIFTIYEMMVK